MLDNASTKTYINADVAAELGLQGYPQRITVSVLNRQVSTIKCVLESLDGKSSYKITAFTTVFTRAVGTGPADPASAGPKFNRNPQSKFTTV